MLKTTSHFKIIGCLLLMTLTMNIVIAWTYSNLKTCSPEKTPASDGQFEWKLRNSNVPYVVSEPDVCWENGSVVVRQCEQTKGVWLPPVDHCDVWEKSNKKCPEDLIEETLRDKVFCLKISNKSEPFNEGFCYGSHKLINPDDRQLIEILSRRGIDVFWLAVRRIEYRRYNPFVVRLPGIQWNKQYQLSFQDILSDKHCVAAYIRNSHSITRGVEVTDCNKDFYSVCVYDQRPVARNGCPQNFGALSYRPSECYGIAWEGEEYPEDFQMLNITEYYKKYRALKAIFEEHDIKQNVDVEVEGTASVTNGKWSINMKTNKLSIVPLENKMKRLSVEHVPNRKSVELVLQIDPEREALVLTVYNKFYIWTVGDKTDYALHCFVKGDYGDMSRIKTSQFWENDSKTKTMFEIKLKYDDPSQYWCEAHTIFNFSTISSQKIVAAKRRKGHAFAMEFDVTQRNGFAWLARLQVDKIGKALAREIKKQMNKLQHYHPQLSELDIHNVRVMDIEKVSPNISEIRCLIHTTASLKSSAVDNSFEPSSEENDSAENEEGTRHDTEVRMRTKELLMYMMRQLGQNPQNSVRSTEYCFPENKWSLAAIGQSATVSTLCLQPNGLPHTRKCMGSFMVGGYWQSLPNANPDCITDLQQNVITKDLFQIDFTRLSQKEPEKAVLNIRKLLESHIDELIPADLYYLARIIRHSIKSITGLHSTDSRNEQTLNISDIVIEIVRIYNYLMNANDAVMHSSIALNSTNILLAAFEHLIDNISVNNKEYDVWLDTVAGASNSSIGSRTLDGLKNPEADHEIDVVDYSDVGVVVKVASNVVIFVLDPSVANVTGVALFKADVKSGEEFNDEGMLHGAFKNEYYRLILSNQNITALLNEYNIIMGTFVPSTLWQRLDEISNLSNITGITQRPEPRVVIKVYSNDKFFQEDNFAATKILRRKVISVSIPGHDKNLPDILPLVLTASKSGDGTNNQYCSYWNYKTWANDGLMFLDRSELNNNTILCGCTHLTPFAYLIGGSYNLSIDLEVAVIITKRHEVALDLITFLGCSLSLFGIVGIFITACIFRSWRQKANSKILLQLSAAIGLQMVLFCFVNTEEYYQHLIANEIFTNCIAIGACLHYSVLVQFCWMVIIAYLQFKRYVQVFGNTRPKRFFVKSTLAGWGIPIIPVAFVLIFDSSSYITHDNDSVNPICYPSGMSLYITIVLPVTLIILANLLIFLVVIYNIVKSPAGTIRRSEKNLALSQIRLLVLLFFLLGFTWIFGLLTTMKAGLVFSYLFCLTATLQGFVLFIYFVLMDPVTRRMWCGYLRKLVGMKVDINNSSSSVKETTQDI